MQNGLATVHLFVALQVFLPLPVISCEGTQMARINKKLNNIVLRTPKLSALSLMALAIESDQVRKLDLFLRYPVYP